MLGLSTTAGGQNTGVETGELASLLPEDADALDAVQMTWLRLAENAHRVQLPERLGGWLVTTARRECLRILRQAKSAPNFIDVGAETVADPSVGPEQRVIGADTARTLWTLVGELPPRRRTLLRALFTDNPPPYAEVGVSIRKLPGAAIDGISPGQRTATAALWHSRKRPAWQTISVVTSSNSRVCGS